ncbi:MAG TPA: hypothetical protein IAC25_02500 [Candidatus Enterenecus stercoripullorum]|nr:hypothetical protein [Candidatus Enterenecus stercoripullorum]
MATTKYISTQNLQEALDLVKAKVVLKETGKGLSTNDLTNELKQKCDQAATKVEQLEATGGQANVIEKIKVNGTEQQVGAEKDVNITVPTKVSDLTNDSKFQTEEQVNAKISAVYKPGGSLAFASLPEPSATVLGMVYNVTDGFTTTDNFLEGAGKAHPAGENVAVVDVGEGNYKFDVLSGFVDLSGYTNTEGMTQAIGTAKQEAISAAASATDTKLATYVKAADLVAATTEEIQAMFTSWTA